MNQIKVTKSCDSIFENIELVETIDVSILDKLINSNLLQTTSWKAGAMTFENEKQQLQLLRKNIKNNKLKVVYKKAKYGYGRVYPQKSLSLCSLRRQIRHTLSFHQYVDIDVVNCHPELLLQICEHNNIKTKYLKQYVENRDSILVEVQREYNCDRDQAKLLFIILAYYGSFSTWINDNNIENKEPTDFIQDYINELQCIGLKIVQANPELLKAVKDAEKKNEKASVVSIFLQEKERLVLEIVFEYLKSKGIINKECVLCFDGIMILKDKYSPDLLEELSQVVLTRSGFKLKFTEKKMDEHYLDQLTEALVDSFEYQATQFEMTHCKIINKSIYIKQTETDIIVFSKGKLKDAYEHLTCDDKNGKEKLFIDLWTTGNKNIRSFDDMNTYPHPIVCPNNIFNLWTPFKCEQYTDSYKPNKEGLDIILNHIKILCGNDEVVSDYFIKWIGQMIQYPATKTICPTLISKEGAGKGTLIKLMTKMLGKKKVFETTDPNRDVWGNFNSQMINAFFVNLNELSKKDTVESQGKIKGLITDTSLTINAKGKDQFEMNSYHRFIITTNKEDPIATSQDDRRNIIIRTSDELIGNKEYFNKLHTLLDDVNVIRTCYDYFKSIPDLDKFNNIPLPKTSYQENLRLLDLSPPEQFLIEFCSKNEGLVEVENKDFYNQFNEFIETSNIEYKTTPLKFGVKIANLKIDGVEKGKHTKTGDYRNIDIDRVKKHFKIVDPKENPFIEEEKEVKVNYYSPSSLDCSINFSD
jgi:hypothetical protein